MNVLGCNANGDIALNICLDYAKINPRATMFEVEGTHMQTLSATLNSGGGRWSFLHGPFGIYQSAHRKALGSRSLGLDPCGHRVPQKGQPHFALSVLTCV